jgi:hypothetical protein
MKQKFNQTMFSLFLGMYLLDANIPYWLWNYINTHKLDNKYDNVFIEFFVCINPSSQLLRNSVLEKLKDL